MVVIAEVRIPKFEMNPETESSLIYLHKRLARRSDVLSRNISYPSSWIVTATRLKNVSSHCREHNAGTSWLRTKHFCLLLVPKTMPG
jgi:hypothetical protein